MKEVQWAYPWATIETEEEAQAIFLTVPDDEGSEFGGACEGPGVVMAWMEELHAVRNEKGGLFYVENPVCGGPKVEVFDAGDTMYDGIEAKATKWREKGRRIVALGGDHSNTEALVRGVKPKSLLWLDAHPDFWKTTDRSYAATLRRLIEDGVVGARHVRLVGVRSAGEAHRLEMQEMGLLRHLLCGHDLMTDSMHYVSEFMEHAEPPIYVSVDIDVCDPAFAPGVSDPVPGGLTSRELIEIIRICARSPKLIGLDVMECVPSMDDTMRTAHLAGWLVIEALSNLPVLN